MRRSIFFAVLVFLAAIFFSGCSSGESGGVGEYIGADSDFTLVYPGDVSVKSEKRGRVVVGVIDGTGMSFRYDLDSGACSVECGGAVIPLSGDASAGLGGVMAAVFPVQFESGYAGERLFLDSGGSGNGSGGRILLENGVPVSVELGGRVIEIQGFEIIEAGECDETQERGVH